MALEGLLDPKTVRAVLRSVAATSPLRLHVLDACGRTVVRSHAPVASPAVVGPAGTAGTPVFAEVGERSAIELRGERIGEVVAHHARGESTKTTQSAARAIAALLAELAAKESELRGLSAELLERYDEIALLHDLCKALGTVFEVPTICQIALDHLLRAVRADRAAVILVDARTDAVQLVAAHGREHLASWRPGSGSGISGRVVLSARGRIVHAEEALPADALAERTAFGGQVLSVPLQLETGDGVGDVFGALTLGRTVDQGIFTAGDLQLAATIARQAATAIYKSRAMDALRTAARVQHELEIASEIQAGLLPERAPKVEGASVFGRCVPAFNVGGDYFDTLCDERGRLSLLIADVSGHSVGTALMLAVARSHLRRELLGGRAPAAVLRMANAVLYDDLLRAGMFISVFCARYDPETRRLSYANGGHNPPLVWQAATDRLSELDADGIVLGVLPDVGFEERSIEMAPGDAALLFTDGIVEARDTRGLQFGTQRLRAAFRENARLEPESLTTHLCEVLESHCGPTRQDDVTLLSLRIDAAAEALRA